MESISSSFKRFLRRRRYQRLYGSNNNKRKLKVVRLGGETPRRVWKLRKIPKLQLKLKVASPIRVLVNFHDSYVDLMLRLANGMHVLKRKGLFGGKKIAKQRDQISMASFGDEVIDTKLVFQIYNRIASIN